MDNWLRSSGIPEKDKLSYAVKALTGDAYKWWLRENTPRFYTRPILDWEKLKGRMYEEFEVKC